MLRRVFVVAVLVAAALAAMPVSAAPVEPLVVVQWLQEHLRDPQIVVIDVRSGDPVYDGVIFPAPCTAITTRPAVTRNGVLQPPNQAELDNSSAKPASMRILM